MRAVRTKEEGERNSSQVVSFIAEVTKHAMENPHHPLSRILQEHGYGSGSSSESDFFGSSGSFTTDSQATTGNFGARAFFNTKNSRTTLQPFVGALTHRCVLESEDGGEPTLVPWRGDAALLFVDLSGYSKISAHLISSGGAHALSRAVNGYFESILNIVLDQYAGDVIKFAGDAIVIVWAYPNSDLRENALAAVRCAIELQRRVGMYPVEGTDMSFRMHCGVTAGVMDSEVLLAKDTKAMQRAYHFISGPMFEEIGPVVDSAGTGEVCVSQTVADLCGGDLTTSAENRPQNVRLVVDVDEDLNVVDSLLENKTSSDEHRSEWLEKQLVHPRIASKLRQGFKLSHMAEMRFLCVLFIHKAVEAIAVRDWFAELQQVLDANRCPVVQIIDDDKGTHVIAAVNLYFSEADAASTGIRVARQLEDRKVGCSVGMACGETYCGVVGCDDACRWDITGPSCVRAARLMQFAQKHGQATAMDASVYDATFDVSQLVLTRPDVALKGSPLPVKVYGLSAYANSAPSSISSVLWASPLHYGDGIKRMAEAMADPECERTGHIVWGPIGSGKKTLPLLATQSTQWTTIVHQTADGDAPLALANTIAEWFSYHPNEAISDLAKQTQGAWQARQMTYTLDLALKLVEETVRANEHTMIVAQSSQHMDGQSLAFIREVLRRHERGKLQQLSAKATPQSVAAAPAAASTSASATGFVDRGKFAVTLTGYPLHGLPDADALEARIKQGLRPSETIRVERYDIARLGDVAGNRAVAESVAYWKIGDEYAQVLQEKTGGVAALIPPLVLRLREEFVNVNKFIEENMMTEEQAAPMKLTEAIDVGLIEVSYAGRQFLRNLKWSYVAPQWVARYTELYDALIPRLQLVLRAIAALTNDNGAKRETVFPVVQKLMPKVSEDRVVRDVDELVRLGILAENDATGGACFVRFSTPAMLEVVQSLLTPDQDRILKRMGAKWLADNIERILTELAAACKQGVFFTHRYAAFLWRGAGDREKYHASLRDAFAALTKLREEEDDGGATCLAERLQHTLAIDIEMNADIADPAAVLGGTVSTGRCASSLLQVKNVMSPAIEFCKNYMPSPALGALAGETQKIGYVVCNWPLKIARPDVTYLSDDGWQFLQVNIDSVMQAIDKFENAVPLLPGQKRVYTAEEEKALWTRWDTHPKTLELANTYADEFVAYVNTVVQQRRERVIAFTTPLHACPIPSKKTQFKGALSKAFARFTADTRSGRPMHDCAEGRSHAFNAALMDLALAGWRSPYMFMTLQTVRDACLRMQTVDIMEVKAMAYSFLCFGTHLSALQGGVTAAGVVVSEVDR